MGGYSELSLLYIIYLLGYIIINYVYMFGVNGWRNGNKVNKFYWFIKFDLFRFFIVFNIEFYILVIDIVINFSN